MDHPGKIFERFMDHVEYPEELRAPWREDHGFSCLAAEVVAGLEAQDGTRNHFEEGSVSELRPRRARARTNQMKQGDRIHVRSEVIGPSGYGTIGIEGDDGVVRADPFPDGAWPITLDDGRVTALFEDEFRFVREPGVLSDEERIIG
jgi:hypothetical protein